MSQTSSIQNADFETTIHPVKMAKAVKLVNEDNVPLLLKPNGVPVFRDAQLEVTDKRRSPERKQELQATVKAFSFVAGKQVQNQTDIAKCTFAEEQSNPIKIVYVKPGVNKPAPLVRKRDDPANALKPLGPQKEVQPISADQQLERDVSLGDISGIFKAKEAVEKKRVKSAPAKDQEKKKIEAKKAYAEQVREQNRLKELARQQARKEKEDAKPKLCTEEQEDQAPAKAASEDPLSRVPHASNRFQGQFKNLTKELFQKAKDRVREEKLRDQEQAAVEKERKEREAKFQEDIKLKNQERIMLQKLRGIQGPSLKEREEQQKAEQERAKKEEERQRRYELRMQRLTEDRSKLGLDLISQDKLRAFQEEKLQKQMYEEAVKRQRDYEQIQRERARDKNVLNKDIIDFAHPQLRQREQSPPEEKEDQVAEPVVDKKAILREQKLKRKHREFEKLQKDEEEKRKREMAILQLEHHLRQQREDIAKKQYIAQKETARKMAEQQKTISSKYSKRNKSAKVQGQQSRTEQLNDLRDWIEEQMLVEDARTLSPQAAPEADDNSEAGGVEPARARKQPAQVAAALPGNNMLSQQDEKKIGARQNRYGLKGDNGYSDLVNQQRTKEGLAPTTAKRGVIEFTQPEKSPVKSKSPEKEQTEPEKQGKRTIVNQPIKAKKQTTVPGVVNVKEEAARQKAALQEKQTKAATVIQKWARGWKARKLAARKHKNLLRDVDNEHAKFTHEFKVNDQFNLNKFINQKQKLRQLNKTEGLDEESISEQIAESMPYTDVQTDSYIRTQIGASQSASRGTAMVNNFLKPGPAVKHLEHDPLSLIAIFTKRMMPQAEESTSGEIVQTITKAPRKSSSSPTKGGHKRSSPTRPKQDSSRAQAFNTLKGANATFGKQKPSKRLQQEVEDIEEDIVAESRDQDKTDSYSQDHITESIVSDVPKGESTSAIEESIQESIPNASGNTPVQVKAQTSATNDSIPEEDYLRKSNSASINQSRPKDDESVISEESYLKDADQSASLPKIKSNASKVIIQKPFVEKPQKKSERIRDQIEDDYENEGFEDYSGSLKAERVRKQEAFAAKQQHIDYRMSRKAIEDFEESKGMQKSEYKRLLEDLRSELNRYESAVSGQVFLEQFQAVVNKSLAQKDMLMLGQRLAHLETENAHKQEIAQIREEQIRMMSQLMLLSASQTGGGSTKANGISAAQLQTQQAAIMHNIQKLIDKPIVIKTEGVVEQSYGKEQHLSSHKAQPSKSTVPMKVKKSARSSESIEEEIQSEVVAGGSDDEASIDEDIAQSREQQQLSSARRLLGSEQAVIQSSKDLLGGKRKGDGSVFDRGSFQNFTLDKFKDLLTNEGSMMEGFLNQIEEAVHRKSQEQKKQLQKQLETNQISSSIFKKQQRDLEKWVQNEQKEISAKRAKVQDTCADIGAFLAKTEKEKKLMMERLGSTSSTPRKRSISQLSESYDSEGLKQVKDQLRNIREGSLGGDRPETKYLNKKKEYVRQLMEEKKAAVERGVKEKLKDFESEMIDEMLQAALNLDVEKEVQSRIDKARKMVEDNKGEASVSGSMGPFKQAHQRSNGKKNVRFHSPSKNNKDRFSNSSSYQQDSSASKSAQVKGGRMIASLEELNDDMIAESIKLEESYQPSASKGSASASKGKKNSSFRQSASSGKVPSAQSVEKDDDSLDRDENVDYSNDFIEESVPSASIGQSNSANLNSQKALQHKAQDIEVSGGYTETFEDVSIGQSQSMAKKSSGKGKKIAPVQEEDDYDNGSGHSSPDQRNSSHLNNSSQLNNSGEIRESAPSPPKEFGSDIEDKEVFETTSSVDWQVTLQKKKQAYKQEEPSDYGDQIEERSDIEVDADALGDLESNPSASMGHQSQSKAQSSMGDFDMRVDQITDELLNQILGDFKHDDTVKMEIEDDFVQTEFENKWPFTLDKKVEEPEPAFKPPQPQLSQQQIDEQKQAAEREQENEAKRRHDAQMEKYYKEQKLLQEQHKKVVEYLDFMIEIVDKEVLQHALQKPIEHDPLKILEKIQAFDTEDEIDITAMTYSQQQSALPPDLFDEIEKRFEEVRQAKKESQGEKNNLSVMSNDTRNIYHLGIFDAFNEALDQERPYKFKGLPNPWSRQTRVTNETLNAKQVDQIIKRARDRVIEWDLTGAGTKFAPPPPPPPPSGDFEQMHSHNHQMDNEEERNKAERQERLGLLLTKEVHQRENDWLDYEIEDTQVRFDLADMILEELADEITGFLVDKAGGPYAAGNFMEDY